MSTRSWRILIALGAVCCCLGKATAQTDEEMIKRVGLDPRAFVQGQLDPGKLPGLLLWLKADVGVEIDAQGRVTKWSDPERKAALTQAAANQKPSLLKKAQNGQPAVRFAAQSLGLEKFSLGGKSLSVYLVARLTTPSNNGVLLSYGPQDKKYVRPFQLRQNGSTGKLQLGDGAAEGSGQLAGAGFQILQADYAAETRRFSIYANGSLVGSVTQGRELPAVGPLTVGAGLIGDIAEVLVFNVPPNFATRAALTQHLLKKYGLNADKYITPLASQLPFAYYPSSSEIEVAFDRESPLLAEYFAGKPQPPVTPPTTMPGIAYALYTGNIPATGALPDFAKLTPKKTGVTAALSFAPAADGTALVGDHKMPNAVIFKGYLDVLKTGVYTFTLRKLGVARFFVDDRLVVDQPAGQYGPLWKSRGGAIALAAGKHSITLAAKSYGRPPELPLDLVTWSIASSPAVPVPAARFSHGADEGWKLPTLGSTKAWPLPPTIEALKKVEVRVVALKDGGTVKTFTLAIDGGGRGQARFKLPELAEGDYAVDWLVAGIPVRSPLTFTRRHFPFEKNEIGMEHKVYPPFTAVTVKDRTVAVVDRTYTLNAEGLFDSVVSKGKELLAGPMKLVAETTDGKRLTWQGGMVTGEAAYPDQARFTGEAQCSVFSVQSSVSVEEDGCAKVSLYLKTIPRNVKPLGRLYLELTFNDRDVPLFHYTGNDSMRHNYAGKTPKGGKILWDLDQSWTPCVWKAEPGSSDGLIWDATQIKHWGTGNYDNFCPYIWLGTEERGLAWFAGTDHGYINDGREPVQTLSREGDKVVLRIYFIQQPTALDKPLGYTFGLQATPTKPLRADWRTHQVPGGGGLPVNVWGGYVCSDKYPDGADFMIVDKIQEARKTGKVDAAWFKAKDKARAWPDMKIQYESPWLQNVENFAGTAVNQFKTGLNTSCVYFEEHAQITRCPEWQVFQDEWSNSEFNRFQLEDGNWSQAARSYRDFALYFANEWMKRGVSMYFDNTFHRPVTNPYNQDFVGRTITIWEQRDYYKRIWKRLNALNLAGETPYELDFTGHVTNTQTVPQNTWFTATLDLEQDYRVDKTRKRAAWMGPSAGAYRLPFPPDYTRSMTMGRTVGALPHIMSMLSNVGSGFQDREFLAKMPDVRWTSETGMRLVHEIARPSKGPTWGSDYRGSRLNDYLAWFGYGKPAVRIHNYWDEKPLITVSDPKVPWLALTRTASPTCMLLVQSYDPEPVKVSIAFPGGLFGKTFTMMDVYTREVFTTEGNGEVKIPLASAYGTRLLVVARERTELPRAPVANDLVFDDFELGLAPAIFQGRSNMAVVTDEQKPGNHVLRIKPGNPGHERLRLQHPETIPAGDTTLSFRFRLPALPDGKPIRCGILDVTYRTTKEYPKDCGYDLRLQVRRAADGTTAWVVDKVRAMREGQEEKFTEIGANLIDRPLSGIPVDTGWHRLTIETSGTRHTIRVDDTIVLEGTSEASTCGGFSIGPGVGWDLTVPYIEIDDLQLRKR